MSGNALTEPGAETQPEQENPKLCPSCSAVKSTREFGPNRSRPDGLQGHCKECRARRHAQTYDERKATALRSTDEAVKVCSECCVVKDVTEYYVAVGAKDGRRGQCKECVKAKKRAEYLADPTPILERNRLGTRRRRESGEGWTWYNLRARYKMGKDEYHVILAEQEGGCAICRSPHSGIRGFHVDHDHACCDDQYTCGHCVRGFLCKSCNQLLSMARDNPVTLSAAIEYLKRKPITRHVPGRHEHANKGGGRPRGSKAFQDSPS